MRISDWSSDVCSADLIAPLRQFAKLTLLQALPDETTILNFRRLLERDGLAADLFTTINAHLRAHGLLLRQGTMVDSTIIQAPSSTKNRANARDPQMHQTKNGNRPEKRSEGKEMGSTIRSRRS